MLAAVGTLHPAIEVPDSRYDDFTPWARRSSSPTTPARTGSCSAREAPSIVAPLDLAAHAVQGKVASGVEREGVGANVLGDPRTALTWLVNELSGLGTHAAGGSGRDDRDLPGAAADPAGDEVDGRFRPARPGGTAPHPIVRPTLRDLP